MIITRCDRCGEIVNPLYANEYYFHYGSIEYQLCGKCAVNWLREMKDYYNNHNKNTGDYDTCCSVVSSMNKNTGGDHYDNGPISQR